MEDFLIFFADILEVDRNMVSMDTKQNDISEWDSLMQVRIVAEIEETYGVRILSEDVSKYNSILDFYELVKGK